MRRQLAKQAAAVTAMVSLAFLLPLAFLVRELAADRALTRAERDAEAVARFVAVLAPTRGIDGALAALEADRLHDADLSVITAEGDVIGSPVAGDEDLSGARAGVAYRAEVEGGQAVYVPLAQSDGDTAVVRVFVPSDELHQGVDRSWLILAGLGAVLVLLAMLLFDRLGRSVVGAVNDLYQTTERISSGDVQARVVPSGPEEIATVGRELNRLASRIEGLLQDERETAANLSHRLRTPLAAAHLAADAVEDAQIREQLLGDLAEVERSIDHIIAQVRRAERQGASRPIDVIGLVRGRVEFWTPLAEDQERTLDLSTTDGPLMVRVTADDLEAAIDALLGNAMSHTQVGVPVFVSVMRDSTDHAVVAVEDGGPGFPDARVVERGRSGGDSTGLGLDIVASTVRSAGGSIQIGSSRRLGGAMVVLRLPIDRVPQPLRQPGGRRLFRG